MILKQIISFPYQLVHFLREKFFALTCVFGINQKIKLTKPVISIGNISFGGSGKTPFCFELVKHLSCNGLKVCVLSRAYKSQYEQSFLAFKANEHQFDVREIGDEVFMLANKFKEENLDVYFAIGKDRIANAQNVCKIYDDIDVFVLDDGLQQFKLEKDLEIILHNVHERGFYREFAFALNKADILIYTKVDEDWIRKNLGKNYLSFNLSLTKTLQNENDIGVFTGIADYVTLKNMLETHINQASGSKKVKIRVNNYPDHHFFNLEEIRNAVNSGIELVTTEKDWAKIPEEFHSNFNLLKLETKLNPPEIWPQILGSVTKGDSNVGTRTTKSAS